MPPPSGSSKGSDGDQAQGSKKAEQDLKEIQESLLSSIKDLQRQTSLYNLRRVSSFSKEKAAILQSIYYNGFIQSLIEEIKKLEEMIQKNSSESSEISKEISKLNGQLKSSYDLYDRLKKEESVFHNYKEKFGEEILKNESDKAREIKLHL